MDKFLTCSTCSSDIWVYLIIFVALELLHWVWLFATPPSVQDGGECFEALYVFLNLHSQMKAYTKVGVLLYTASC